MTIKRRPDTPRSYLPEAPTNRAERRSIIFTSGVWLMFLTWTALGLVESTAALPVQIAGWAALVAFPVIYLNGFIRPELIPGLNRHVNTLAYTLVLVLLGVVMAQATPAAIINIVPYLMALWIFNHRLLTGGVAIVVIFSAAATLVTVMGFEQYANWFVAAVGSPAVIMIFIRISMELGAIQQYRAEQLVLARQREELASTVHDVLGHSLTTITVKVQLAQRLLTTDLPAAETELADIEALARRSLSEVRATVTDLQHPNLVDQLDQAKTAFTAAGITLHRPKTLPRLTLVQQQVFGWVLREAVTNVLRHAHATTCMVSLTEQENQLVLRIDDDGIGLPQTDPTPNHGLAGLQRRVTAAGGSLELRRLAPGTRLEVLL